MGGLVIRGGSGLHARVNLSRRRPTLGSNIDCWWLRRLAKPRSTPQGIPERSPPRRHGAAWPAKVQDRRPIFAPGANCQHQVVAITSERQHLVTTITP